MNTHAGTGPRAAVALLVALVGAAICLASGGAAPERAWAGDSFACGLLKQWEVEHAFEWPVDAPLTCEIDEGPLGQWAVQCDETGDPVACDEASEITAVETNSFRFDRSATADRYLKRFRRNATETILGYPARVTVRDENPTTTGVSVLVGKRRFVTVGVYSYDGGKKAGARYLARRAVRRWQSR